MHSDGGEREKMSALIIHILRRSSRFYLPAVRIHGRVTLDLYREAPGVMKSGKV